MTITTKTKTKTTKTRTCFRLALALCVTGASITGCSTELPTASDAGEPIRVTGFDAPESALHDPLQDVYFVSNLAGAPLERDHNGFISRVSPAGDILELRFIDGAGQPDGLSAPKGMALLGRTLFVTDIDVIRAYDADSGQPEGSYQIAGASFLNDLTTDGKHTVYASDTGLDAEFNANGTEAVYALTPGEPARKLPIEEPLGAPNGLLWSRGRLELVSFGSGEWITLARAGEVEQRLVLQQGGLDGIVQLEGGDFAITSWQASAVQRLSRRGEVSTLVDGLNGPADLGYDVWRRRLLVPLMQENTLLMVAAR